ncbi:MAG: hypothetical protein AB8F74_17365 [Saprospiraceae bacterium]
MKSSPLKTFYPKMDLHQSGTTQIIYLNRKGEIIYSTNNLFSTILLQKEPVFNWSPFMESIFPCLFEDSADEAVQFFRVTTIQTFLPGIYDYTFVRLPKELAKKDTLAWIINDRTKCYERMTELQQIDNEEKRAAF